MTKTDIIKPFFSVIITTYNRPDQIKRAITSVLGQDFLSFEIIIVNDGSLVPYDEVLNNIKGINNIRYYYKENEERSIARNFGVEKSQGKFICFLDDDDYYLKNHLQILYKRISAENFVSGIYHTYSKILNIEHKIILPDIIAYEGSKLTLQEFYVTQGVITMNSYCASKDVLIDYPYDPNLIFAEDHNQRLRAMYKYKVFQIKEYTNIYDKSNETSTSTGNISVILGYINSWKYNFKIKEIRNAISKEVRNSILFNYYHLLLNYHRNELPLKDYLFALTQMMLLKPTFKTFLLSLHISRWKLTGR